MHDAPTVSTDRIALAVRGDRNGAIGAECAALTGSTPDDGGIATDASIDRINRAAYVQRGLQVLAEGSTFGDLVEQVARRAADGLDADNFRVDVHDPAGRLETTSTQTAIAIADVLPFYPDLSNPQHEFVVVVGPDRFHFGEVITEADASYRRHDDKPWTTSSSLDSRFARALVNLVPDARSILDPCCGAGAIVLETASLGLEAFGVDWKPAMAGMTRENLDHFGYDATVVRADSRTHAQPADAIVTDLPYGHAIEGDEDVIRAILGQCAALAPIGVFVASGDISAWLVAAGHTVVGLHTVVKRRGFTRWIHVTRSRSFDIG